MLRKKNEIDHYVVIGYESLFYFVDSSLLVTTALLCTKLCKTGLPRHSILPILFSTAFLKTDLISVADISMKLWTLMLLPLTNNIGRSILIKLLAVFSTISPSLPIIK